MYKAKRKKSTLSRSIHQKLAVYPNSNLFFFKKVLYVSITIDFQSFRMVSGLVIWANDFIMNKKIFGEILTSLTQFSGTCWKDEMP